MELIHHLIDFVLHLDTHLGALIQQYGSWTYAILFVIIFCETGLVVTPFLPGDSLLFAVGTFAARGDLNVATVLVVLSVAAIAGDTLNYWIGSYIGPKAFHYENSRLFKKEHLVRTHEFYEKHGGKTIIFARFMPIIRTFAPFVAGIGKMSYGKFLSYNVIGGILWIVLLTLCGYFFGNIPVVKKNFTFVIFAIIIISLIPGVIEYLRQRKERAR